MTTIRTRTGTITLYGVHGPGQCVGRPCVIHAPTTPTHRRNLHWRDDQGFFEDVCRHGVGHPAPEDVAYRPGLAVHGCDGCCATFGHPSKLAWIVLWLAGWQATRNRRNT